MICDIYPFLKMCRKSDSRHEHIPSSLAECLERPSTTRREARRLWPIILLILPTLYYINDLLLDEGQKHEDLVLRRSSNKMVLNATVIEMTAANIQVPEVITRVPPNSLPICIEDKSHLGKFLVKKPDKTIFLENEYAAVLKGGYYLPAGCQSRHKVGILVPYRDREESLLMFMYNIHPFLMKQKLEYRIFVVEQSGTDKFNKGRLFNAGFKEMKKYGSWHCIVFHDVDLLPLDERILYSCPSWPRHMCATVVDTVYNPSYHNLFGGVTSMTPDQYEKINGYSNLYWGWGGEDHDIFWRLRFAGIRVMRYQRSIARYKSLPHALSPHNPLSSNDIIRIGRLDSNLNYQTRNKYELLHGRLGKYMQEGLSTLEYKLVSVTERHLYTHIVVDINLAGKINANSIKLVRKLQD